MTATPHIQWNFRLDAETSDALRRHLESPLLVGLPKGSVATFMRAAIIAELERRGAWRPVGDADTLPSFF